MPTSCLSITTHNRTEQLRNSLRRLSELTLPDEILIVDDGGNDGCFAIRSEFPQLPIRYVYVDNPGETLYTRARNVGIKHTDADLWITTDPENRFKTDVIAQLLAVHERYPEHMVQAGTVRCLGPDGSLQQTCLDWVAPHACLGVRQWLLDVGGFDEQFPAVWGWDDTDLFTRLRIAGHGQKHFPEIEVTHQWHRRMDASGQHLNEQHFKAKSFIVNGEHDLTDLVANRGHEWGQIL